MTALALHARRAGGRSDEHVTLLHGFPGSSTEWAGVRSALEPEHRLLLPDLLGYGSSPKPADGDFSVIAQADAVQALWAADGVSRTSLLGYDVGGMVVMELLARGSEDGSPVAIDQVVLLNSALFADTYRPRLITRLMAGGPVAPLARKALNERSLARSWGATFSATHPLDAGLAATTWQTLIQGAEPAHAGRLLSFVRERRQHGPRWDAALAGRKLHLIWGRQDLVSGADADHVVDRLPQARLTVLNDLGHAPHLEDPARVGPLLCEALDAAS